MRTRVKICGITRPEDALAAANAGADAIGLVFYEPSPRAVDIRRAAQIVETLPPFVSSVGLFVNADESLVRAVLKDVPLDLLQFHGDESPEDCEKYPRPYIKALRVSAAEDIQRMAPAYQSAAGILLDSYVKGVPGGTGRTFNWDWIPKETDFPLVLAGGLTPDNVAPAIRQAQPWAVDVSGGVEAAKGIKDSLKIVDFMRGVADGR